MSSKFRGGGYQKPYSGIIGKMAKGIQAQIQAKLNKAAAVDLDILGKYEGKEVILNVSGEAYSGTLRRFGQQFVKLVGCRYYDKFSVEQLEEGPRYLDCCSTVANRTVSRDKIEQIVLFHDVQRGKGETQTQGEQRK